MVWRIEWAEEAAREFRKLDHSAQKTIRDYLVRRIAEAENPRDFGKPLKRHLAGLWRYRIGDYRVICRIDDTGLTLLVLRAAHRRRIYDE